MSKTKFYQNNKDIFLKHFLDCGNYSAETIYDLMIQAGAFEKMESIIKAQIVSAEVNIERIMQKLS